MKDEGKTREQLLAEIAELQAEIGQYRGLFDTKPGAAGSEEGPAEDETARWLSTLLAGLSSAEIGIDIVSADRQILYQNSWLERLFPGRTGDVCHRVYVGREEPCMDCPMDRALRSGETTSGVIEGADGRQYLVVATLLPSSQGEPARVLEVVFDVTERALAEKTARAERDRAQRYLDIAGVMLVAIGADERVELINQKGAALLGGNVDEIVGANWFELFVPGDQREEVRAVFEKLMSGEVEPVERYENHVLTVQGELRLIAWHNTVLRDDDGRITGTLSSGDDITSRRAVSEALRKSEELSREVLETIPDGVIVCDLEGTVTYSSPAATRIYGAENQAEVVGQNAFEFFVPEDRERAASDMFTALERGRLLGREFTLTRKDGSTYPAEVSAGVLRDTDGAPSGIVAIFRDITERRKWENRLRSLASDLSLAAEKERRRIATELHDQVGQTLAVANLKLGTLYDEVESEEHRARLDEVRNHWQNAMAYTRSLTAELSPPVLYELGFEAAVEWLVERQKALREDLELEFVDNGQPKPLGDDLRVSLFQAVRELLINVIKHSEATSATVTLSRAERSIQIVVEDDGIGFDTESRDVVGEEFGLYSVAERLGALGGSIEVDSVPGRGTRITLTAPLSV